MPPAATAAPASPLLLLPLLRAQVGFDGATHVVVVVSTTGDGDAPSNAEDFCRHLRKRTQPKALLAGKRFAILGLGDTNYDKFWCVICLRV